MVVGYAKKDVQGIYLFTRSKLVNRRRYNLKDLIIERFVAHKGYLFGISAQLIYYYIRCIIFFVNFSIYAYEPTNTTIFKLITIWVLHCLLYAIPYHIILVEKTTIDFRIGSSNMSNTFWLLEFFTGRL